MGFYAVMAAVRGFQFDTWGRQFVPSVNDGAYFDDFSFESVPEPTRCLMLMIGAITISLRRRR